MIHPAKPSCWELSLSIRTAEIWEEHYTLQQWQQEERGAVALCMPPSRCCGSFALWV